jgi:hypothetical protein
MSQEITLETIVLGVSALAEFLVAWVIYYEWEAGRLDHFLDDADLLADDRDAIYKAYCGLPHSNAKSRSQAFKEHLESQGTQELLTHCHKNIRLLSRIGSRLPIIPWLKRTPVDWHVAALLWMILGPYVESRRAEAGPTYADNFLKYALASTDHLLSQERDTWTIRDPDRTRKQDVSFSRAEMKAMRNELKKRRKRKG